MAYSVSHTIVGMASITAEKKKCLSFKNVGTINTYAQEYQKIQESTKQKDASKENLRKVILYDYSFFQPNDHTLIYFLVLMHNIYGNARYRNSI